ncbi:MAG: DUF4166 domain-containing protein, partial [Betaproteobacteria bacterium]|nr:DUF4166 domain-containing protein [Betaproteobacteria bacterium]
MKSLMQMALGADWDKLPLSLQAHYRFGTTIDSGHMDIEYPRWMQPCLSVLRCLGALVDRRGRQVATVVEKEVVGNRQFWRRTLTYPDGRTRRFDSFWVAAGDGHLIEFVNPLLGLRMAPYVEDGRLHYRGIEFVAKPGPWLLPIPEWLLLGHTTIVEEALDDNHFAMDFRLTHPLFGQLFHYSGPFAASAGQEG